MESKGPRRYQCFGGAVLGPEFSHFSGGVTGVSAIELDMYAGRGKNGSSFRDEL